MPYAPSYNGFKGLALLREASPRAAASMATRQTGFQGSRPRP